jgi:ABC-type transport system substrate-binding protein
MLRSRRAFCLGLGAAAAASLLAACGGGAAPTATPAAKPTQASIVPPTQPSPTAATAPAAAPAATTAPAAAAPTQAPAAATKPAAAASSPAAGASPAAAGGAPKRGGQLKILQTNDFVSMDPIHASGPTASMVYDSLLAWRPNAQGQYAVEPKLAKSFEVSPNKLIFKLRENVKFHDGSDLNADVVVWNLKRMVQNPKSFAKNYLSAVDDKDPASAIDPMTVQVNLKRPSAAILSSLSDANGNTFIVSKKAADDKGEEWLKLNPVGSGPYKFVSFQSGDKLELKRNESYWQMGADGKALPYADGITYRVIVEAATQFAEMRAGSADFAQGIRGRDVPAAKQIAHARYIESPYSGNKRQYFFNAVKGPFAQELGDKSLKLRQAVHHAVDREAIAKAVGGGLGFGLPYEFVPGAIGYDTAVPTYNFDLDKAKQLMKESGYATPLEVRMVVHNREQDVQQAQIIQQMVDKIGIKLNLQVVERVAWGEVVRIKNDFEMASRQSGVAVDPTDDLLVTWAEGGNSAYHRAKVAGLLDTLNKADGSYDAKERQNLFVQAQRLMYESAWFGYLWFEPGNFLVHKRVQGFPASWGSLRESEWWISE